MPNGLQREPSAPDGGRLPLTATVTEPLAPTFDEYASRLTARNGVRLAALFLAGAVLWWPFDAWIFASTPEVRRAFAWMRLGSAAVNLAVVLVIWRVGIPRRFVGATTLGIICAQLFCAGFLLGGAEYARPHDPAYFFLAPLLSVVVIWPLGRRTLAACAIAASTWAGFLANGPAVFGDNLVEFTLFMGFCCLLATGLGHLIYRVLHANYEAQTRLAERDRELRELAESLEERVRAQTIELRRLNAHVEDRLEAERSRIAADLHDELGQQLAAMRFALDFGRRSADPGSLSVVMGELDTLLDRTHETVRGILRGVHPQVLQQLDLVDALRWLGSETTSRTSATCTVTAAVEIPQLPVPLRTSLFRCVQEALTNAVRHGRADTITMNVTTHADELVLQVEDNGVGFSGAPSSGLGMTSIRERARRWGGDATWRSTLDEGTVCTVRVPLPATSVADS